MRAFPPALALRMFIGDALAQVRLDPFGLQFSFESGRLIHVEHAIEHRGPDGAFWPYDCQAAERPPVVLHRLLGLPVSEIERDDLRLTLKFQGGASLAILSALHGYECGAIVAPEIGYSMF